MYLVFGTKYSLLYEIFHMYVCAIEVAVTASRPAPKNSKILQFLTHKEKEPFAKEAKAEASSPRMVCPITMGRR